MQFPHLNRLSRDFTHLSFHTPWQDRSVPWDTAGADETLGQGFVKSPIPDLGQ